MIKWFLFNIINFYVTVCFFKKITSVNNLNIIDFFHWFHNIKFFFSLYYLAYLTQEEQIFTLSVSRSSRFGIKPAKSNSSGNFDVSTGVSVWKLDFVAWNIFKSKAIKVCYIIIIIIRIQNYPMSSYWFVLIKVNYVHPILLGNLFC